MPLEGLQKQPQAESRSRAVPVRNRAANSRHVPKKIQCSLGESTGLRQSMTFEVVSVAEKSLQV